MPRICPMYEDDFYFEICDCSIDSDDRKVLEELEDLIDDQLEIVPPVFELNGKVHPIHLVGKRFTIGEIHVNGLGLTKKKLTYFPECVLSLSKLKRLHLEDNLIPSIPENLDFLKDLRELDLSSNQISS
ncbi:unnamed protein product, partial [marine sediment metagenome]